MMGRYLLLISSVRAGKWRHWLLGCFLGGGEAEVGAKLSKYLFLELDKSHGMYSYAYDGRTIERPHDELNDHCISESC